MSKQPTTEYIPGTCNINFAEIAYRRNAFRLFFVITVVSIVAIFALKAPIHVRVIVFIPAFIAILNYLQVKNRFCVMYGKSGEENATEGSTESRKVTTQDALAKDKKRAKQLNSQATIWAALLTLILIALPQVR